MPASIKHLTDKKVRYNSLLARWTDGLYYAAALTKCDKTNKRCRICFEDGSEVWVSNRDLHIQLSFDQLSEDEDDIVCCICDDGDSAPPNEIILCDVCQQGYHQKCHIPPVDSSKLDESDETKDHKDWFCATCSYILNQTNRAKLSSAAMQQQQPQAQPQKQKPKQQEGPPAKQSKVEPPQAPKTKQTPVTKAPATSAKVSPPATTIPSQSPKPKQNSAPQQVPQQQQPPHIQQQIHQKPQPEPRASAQPKPSTPQPIPKSTVGAVKSTTSAQQRSTPYYPLSSQVRSAATSSSTAALASMTASSALIVGSIAGRSKQDIVVKQINRTTQRQSQGNEINIVESNVSPPKHAVRKSSVNYVVSPVRQSALPTATRSVPSPNTSNGQGNRELIAATLSTTTISPTKTSSVSVLTSPAKQHPDQAVRQSEKSDKVGSTSNVIIDNRNLVHDSARNGSSQPPISPNVSSSSHVTSDVKVIHPKNETNAVKQTSESNINSTSDYRQVVTSTHAQRDNPVVSSGQPSVIQVPGTDLSGTNDSGLSSANKSAKSVVGVSPSK